jgi:RNA polymerase primary sigma factor
MKTARRKRQVPSAKVADTPLTAFSSDLLTPEEERELLTSFWDCKSELVRVLIRHFPDLRASKPPLEPWPMAQFIRDNCNEPTREVMAVRRLHDRYVHFKHRLASANIRLAAHVAKRFRHHSLSYSDLLQEAVCGLMQAIDRFDVSHGTRLATYATWWIRQTLQRPKRDRTRCRIGASNGFDVWHQCCLWMVSFTGLAKFNVQSRPVAGHNLSCEY